MTIDNPEFHWIFDQNINKFTQSKHLIIQFDPSSLVVSIVKVTTFKSKDLRSQNGVIFQCEVVIANPGWFAFTTSSSALIWWGQGWILLKFGRRRRPIVEMFEATTGREELLLATTTRSGPKSGATLSRVRLKKSMRRRVEIRVVRLVWCVHVVLPPRRCSLLVSD